MSATLTARHPGFRATAPSALVPATSMYWWFWRN